MKKRKPINTPVPPKSAQFPKGKSGNPRGRPKGARTLSGMLKRALEAQVEKEGTNITKLEAAVTKIADAAAAGDPRMLQMLLNELRRIEPAPVEAPNFVAETNALMEGARERVMAKLARLHAEQEREQEEVRARGICPACSQALPGAA